MNVLAWAEAGQLETLDGEISAVSTESGGGHVDLKERVERWLLQVAEQSSSDSRATAEAFHKTMTALSSGAIALSIVFVEKLLPPNTPVVGRGLLIASWSLFVLSLLLILVGFRLTLRNYYDAGRLVGTMVADTMFVEEYSVQTVANSFRKYKENKTPDVLAWLAIASFVVGVVFLLSFAYANYS